MNPLTAYDNFIVFDTGCNVEPLAWKLQICRTSSNGYWFHVQFDETCQVKCIVNFMGIMVMEYDKEWEEEARCSGRKEGRDYDASMIVS